MTDQLNQAYDLIKAGDTFEAIKIIEPIIRSDRDNEDAWWLLANATSDPEAKRNALHNVLRLSNIDSRREKAQEMLSALDDPFAFDTDNKQSVGMSTYQAIDEAPQKKGGMSCATISLIIAGLVGVCAMVACFGIFAVGQEVFSIVNPPENALNGGIIELGETYSDSFSASDRAVTYQFSTNSQTNVSLTLESEAATAPFIVVYDADGMIVTYAQSSTGNTVATSFNARADENYLIAIWGFTVIGVEVGYGDYTLEVE